MSDGSEVIRGSGNAFRDFGHVNADAEQLKALLAAQVIGLLDARGLTATAAAAATGCDPGDLTSIRRAELDGLAIDRLMGILDRFGQDVTVAVRPRSAA